MQNLFCRLGYVWAKKSLESRGKCFYKQATNNNFSFHFGHANVIRILNAPFCSTASQERLQTVKLAFDSYESTKDAVFSSLPVVIIHGLLGSKTNWRSLSKDLSRRTGHKIYAVDVRNHGDSPHTENFNYYSMAADLENFLREMEINNTILIGHSMGGRIAMITALNKPELVQKLVIVDVSPVSIPDAFDADISVYMEVMSSSLKEIPVGTSLSQARQLVNKLLSTAVPNIGTRQFLLTNLVELNKEIRWRCNLEVLQRKFKEDVREFPAISGQYDGETLFICGSNSQYVPKSDHEKIRKIFCNSKFRYVDGAGHWVHAEKPAEFTKILIEFIQC